MIYKFAPILKTLVWGTENWVLSGVPGNESVCAATGKTLNEIWGGEFPLLIKFIDAKKDLSIQVHPDDELAAKRHGCNGKTEMWYIIGASEGAHLLCGLNRAITPEDYVRLVQEDRITEVIKDHKVSPGDVFFLPAGRIHAICGGCYLAEIQETSDITYRIYDYGRLGLDGKPRQLHTEQAKDAIDYSVHPDYRTHYTPAKDKEVELVRDSHFVTSLCEITSPIDIAVPAGKRNFLILIGLEGECKVEGTAAKGSIKLSAGESLLVLEESSVRIAPTSKETRFLTVRP
ncbi:MAG: class I mannose-6-phosphate isomerase [Bacteroidales bacterium]|nr:class I mannose-6-phosphate isomerase [Bacteroidales bacterium]